MKTTCFACALWACLGIFCPQFASAQTQNLKGIVVDKSLQTPLIGANIQATASGGTFKGTSTDVDGQFRLEALPLGKYTVQISYIGYEPAILNNVELIAGKETELLISLAESVVTGTEVVVTARVDKEKPLNELSTVSTRTFSVEETTRFAAAVNDPARMATSFAGVMAFDDGNNHIVIRGNAPNGLLWRMEGIDIPNPNHFSRTGTSGGGISILSAQLMANSDFSTGAFAAEYGNALAGVFDIKLRRGNTDKREFTFKAGFLGLDAAAEGPLRLGKQKGSYLVNYRYSTLSLISQLGIDITGVNNFQDLSFNLWLPAGKAGTFSLFGFGGLSNASFQGTPDTVAWEKDDFERYNFDFISNSGVVGLKHRLVLGNNTTFQTTLAASAVQYISEDEEMVLPDYQARKIFDSKNEDKKITLMAVLGHKFNARHYLRAGAYGNWLSTRYRDAEWVEEYNNIITRIDHRGKAPSLNAFAQWQYRPTNQITFNMGLHSMAFFWNDKVSVEPRAALQYKLDDNQSISLGYGLHSQLQPLNNYFVENENGQLINPELDFSKAHHLVLGYDRKLSDVLRIKSELYYQSLFNMPVAADERNAFYLLNENFGLSYEPLANTGKGRNYGVEFTVEHFLHRGFYMLLSSAWYKAQYQGSDEVWHSSRYDNRMVNTLTAGKQWDWTRKDKDRTIGLNIKIIQAGGQRATPLDLEASQASGKVVLDESRSFEDQLPGYFRLDWGVQLQRNYRKMTTTVSLDVQNTTNRENIFGVYYDEETFERKLYTQTPLIPILAYKIQF